MSDVFHRFGISCLVSLAGLATSYGSEALAQSPTRIIDAPHPDVAKAHFTGQDKKVLTFLGYSGAGYEHPRRMLEQARKILSQHDPDKTIVNIGATASGIGAVYEIAKSLGFQTTGIVSTQAKAYEGDISPHVDTVIYVLDDAWGGFVGETDRLSPTSQAMVDCSDIMVCIGGGAVSRDELTVAKRQGKTIKYFPAEMNHTIAVEKARKEGLPVPTDFNGAVHGLFGDRFWGRGIAGMCGARKAWWSRALAIMVFGVTALAPLAVGVGVGAQSNSRRAFLTCLILLCVWYILYWGLPIGFGSWVLAGILVVVVSGFCVLLTKS